MLDTDALTTQQDPLLRPVHARHLCQNCWSAFCDGTKIQCQILVVFPATTAHTAAQLFLFYYHQKNEHLDTDSKVKGYMASCKQSSIHFESYSNGKFEYNTVIYQKGCDINLQLLNLKSYVLTIRHQATTLAHRWWTRTQRDMPITAVSYLLPTKTVTSMLFLSEPYRQTSNCQHLPLLWS